MEFMNGSLKYIHTDTGRKGDFWFGVTNENDVLNTNKDPTRLIFKAFIGEIYDANGKSQKVEKAQANDVVTVKVDMSQKQLSFRINEMQMGQPVALKSDSRQCRAFICLYYKGNAVELL